MTSADRSPLAAVLYTRRDCPLCDEMKAEIERAGAGLLALEVVDVDRDAELVERFGWRVPVLEIGGEVAFEGCLEAERLAARVARLRAREL